MSDSFQGLLPINTCGVLGVGKLEEEFNTVYLNVSAKFPFNEH